MPSFARLASVTASTKRSAGVVNGLEAAYTESIASLKCLPLDPVDPNLAQVDGLAWHELLQTAVEGGLDVQEGDILVVATIEYPIRAVSDWTWPPDTLPYQVLIIEDVK